MDGESVVTGALAVLFLGLAVYDQRTKRLPLVLMVPAYIAAAALLVGFQAMPSGWWLTSLALFSLFLGLYLLQGVIQKPLIGGGDSLLAGLVGLVFGITAWPVVGVAALITWAIARRSPTGTAAFAPGVAIAAVSGLVLRLWL